jgi:cytochrome o ubiquinol oxidase subunit 2
MHFAVRALPADRFEAWVTELRAAGAVLNAQAYQALARQSVQAAPSTYRGVEDGLFGRIVSQAVAPGPGPDRATGAGL